MLSTTILIVTKSTLYTELHLSDVNRRIIKIPENSLHTEHELCIFCIIYRQDPVRSFTLNSPSVIWKSVSTVSPMSSKP